MSRRTGHFTFREHELPAAIDNINLTMPEERLRNKIKQTAPLNLLDDVQTFINSQVNHICESPSKLDAYQEAALLKIAQYKEALTDQFVELEHSTSQTQQSIC